MDPIRPIEEKIVKEKLAVFTFNDVITERSLREYLKRNWNNLTVGMKKSTILFIGGIHGLDTGEFGGREDNMGSIESQVWSAKDFVEAFDNLFSTFF